MPAIQIRKIPEPRDVVLEMIVSAKNDTDMIMYIRERRYQVKIPRNHTWDDITIHDDKRIYEIVIIDYHENGEPMSKICYADGYYKGEEDANGN